MSKAPQYFIDTFKEKDGVLQNGFYWLPIRLDFYYEEYQEVRCLSSDEVIGPKLWTSSENHEEQAITAAWNHFIQQPEVRGLMEWIVSEAYRDGYSDGINEYAYQPEISLKELIKPLKP